MPPGDLHSAQLDAGSFIAMTPDLGVVMVTEPDGTVTAILRWDPSSGDVNYDAPAGAAAGGGTRRHIFNEEIYVGPDNVRDWASLLNVPATFPPAPHTHAFASLKANDPAWPTTVAGYGIVGIVTTLAGLTDVTVTTPVDGQLLRYDSASSKWINTSTMKVASGIVTIGTDPGGTEALRVGGGIRASSVSAFQAGISVSGAASSLNRASTGQTVVNIAVAGDAFGRLNMFSDGTFSMGTGAVTPDATFGRIGAGNVRLTGGSDGNSTWTIGQGGAAPTTGRAAKLVLNTPSSATFVGQAFIQFQLDGVTKWQTGTTTDAISGARLATTDYAWHNGTTYVAGLSTAGVLALAGGLIAGTDPGGTELVRIGGGLRTTSAAIAGGLLQTGTTITRIENTGGAVPTGATGVGLDLLGRYLTGSRIAGIDRTGVGAYTPIYYDASLHAFGQGPIVVGTDPGGSALVRVGGETRLGGGILQTGNIVARFENIAAAAPSGAAGVGLEIYGRYLTGTKLLSYDRTNNVGVPIYIDASAFIVGIDPGGTQLVRVGGAVTVSGTTSIAVSAGTALTVSTSVGSVPVMRMSSSNASNGPLMSLENTSGLAGFRSFAFACNYGVSGALELRISNASNVDPLSAGTTALMITPGRGVRPGDGVILGVAATDGFFYLPGIAGPPTGVPIAYGSSMASAYAYGTRRLYIYNSATTTWDYVQFTT